MDTFKALNNGISNQSLSETAQSPARFFQKNTLVHSVKAVPGYMRKKGSVKSEKNIAATHLIIQTMSTCLNNRRLAEDSFKGCLCRTLTADLLWGLKVLKRVK